MSDDAKAHAFADMMIVGGGCPACGELGPCICLGFGPLVTLRARWVGEAPAVGDHLKAPKGRIAYLIREVTRIKGVPALGSRMLRLRCVRRDVASLPADAVVHGWRWDKRGRR